MPTKTICRIGSDIDLLSRVQLNEVTGLLGNFGTKHSIDFAPAEDSGVTGDSRTQPGTPARIAVLMNALLEGRLDALVLDAVVLPTHIPSGLTIGAITQRITPWDALVSAGDEIIDELAEGAIVVTDSFRREAQIRCYRTDLQFAEAHGSVDSIIQKVNSGRYAAAVVAAADMERLGKQDCLTELLTNSVCIPAAGQGALAILIRSSEDQFRDAVQSINCHTTFQVLRSEWAFLEHLGVDDTRYVGVLGSVERKTLELEGALAVPDVGERIHFIVKGTLGQEEELGRTLAEEILEAGGRDILQQLNLL